MWFTVILLSEDVFADKPCKMKMTVTAKIPGGTEAPEKLDTRLGYLDPRRRRGRYGDSVECVRQPRFSTGYPSLSEQYPDSLYECHA
jgi:hypothetical protein